MTPTAAASPIALLTTVADPNTASSGASASSANAAGVAEAGDESVPLLILSGGFQLLIDAAAEQQTALPIAQKAAGKAAAAPTGKTEQSGNALPLLGALLPTLANPDASQSATAATPAGSDNSSDEFKVDGNADDAKTADKAALQLLWAPVNLPAQPTAADADRKLNTGASAAAAAAVGGVGDKPGNSGVALIDLPNADSKKTATAADNALQVAGDNTAAQQSTGLSPNKPALGERSANARAEVLAAPASSIAKTDVSPQDLIGAVQKPTETSSSFADLLKPDNAATATANPLTAPMENTRAQAAARPYVEMNSTGASINIPVGNSGWSDAVVDKVMWFSANKFSSAEIQLNPPDLGPLQVRISTQHDQASVVFSSPHAAVRDALDQALPRLRDMLGGQGILLSDASVGGQGAQAQQQQQQHGGSRQAPAASSFFQSDDNSAAPVAVTRVQLPRSSASAVDAYA